MQNSDARGTARPFDIVDRLRFDAYRCEATFSKGVAKNIEEAADEIDRLRTEVESLRLTLGGRTFSADIPEPIGCPMPGACAQVREIARLRAAVRDAALLISNDLVGPWVAVHELDEIIA